ncbi:methionine aminopeptidase [Raphidocelis subcapitata]|uniref:Methionine aminopeptidase n=1 Tax=Raphidocelis subcapitata TaxID=307507 RepID=A0A2V0P2N0_9CHLO|nr:methionine aminopeptidase [Raphidocelis subcapitata]|eukprot:GBF92100.1 methionine aminopeptidase [Raphidocelis subcapitata]
MALLPAGAGKQLAALLRAAAAAHETTRGFHSSSAPLGWLRALTRRKRAEGPPLEKGRVSPERPVHPHIPRPPYALGPGPAAGAAGLPRSGKEPEIQDAEGAARMRAAGALAAAALAAAGRLVSPGVTTDALDAAVHDYIIARGGYPSPLRYGGFPKSCCTSVNECICHGVPDDRPLREGDIVNVDVTAFLHGRHGDTNATFYVGEPRPHAAELVEATREALAAAVAACGPGAPFRAIGDVVQSIADRAGLSVVREYVGHGIGAAFHAAPSVLHHRNGRPGEMVLGQTFTIEPILTLGSRHHRCWPDGWTLVTLDGSLAAQFEHTLLITEDGAEVLTKAPPEGGEEAAAAAAAARR